VSESHHEDDHPDAESKESNGEESAHEGRHQTDKMTHADGFPLQMPLEEDALSANPTAVEECNREGRWYKDNHHKGGMVIRARASTGDERRCEHHRERDERHRRLTDKRPRRRGEVSAEAYP